MAMAVSSLALWFPIESGFLKTSAGGQESRRRVRLDYLFPAAPSCQGFWGLADFLYQGSVFSGGLPPITALFWSQELLPVLAPLRHVSGKRSILSQAPRVSLYCSYWFPLLLSSGPFITCLPNNPIWAYLLFLLKSRSR